MPPAVGLAADPSESFCEIKDARQLNPTDSALPVARLPPPNGNGRGPRQLDRRHASTRASHHWQSLTTRVRPVYLLSVPCATISLSVHYPRKDAPVR